MTLRLRVGSKSDVGRTRDRNEDSVLLKEPLFAVADGMGGHRGGDVASSMAVEALEEFDLPNEQPLDALVDQIKRVNHAVLERSAADSRLRGMGTTLTAVLAEDARAHVAHIGDSRAYLLREGNLQQLTEDHTLVQRMVREGRLTPEQARHHPQRSVVTRALGVDEDVPVEVLTLDIHPGDRIVVCSDGLTGMLEEDEVREILQAEPDPQAASERLVDAANDAGGEDNITVVVVDVVDEAAGEPGSGGGSAPEAGASVPLGGSATAVRTRPQAAEAETTIEAGQPAPVARAGEHRTAKGRRIRWGRLALWVAILVVVLIGAGVGVRAYVSHQWYVGESNGQVAVYNGIPAAPLGFHLSHVETMTDISAATAERLQPYRDLSSGITANSREDALAIVTQIQRDLARTAAGGGR